MVKRISQDLIRDLLRKAAESPRARSHYLLHESYEDPIQRLLIAAKRKSYFRLHRHPSKYELIQAIRGRFDLLIFDDEGVVMDRISMSIHGSDTTVELPVGCWHTLVALDEEIVFLEVKPGPFDAKTAGEFASWAPEEGIEADRIDMFQSALLEAKIGQSLA